MDTVFKLWLFASLLLSTLCCSGAQEAKPQAPEAKPEAAEPPRIVVTEPELASLRSGALLPVEVTEPVNVTSFSSCVAGSQEFLKIELPSGWSEVVSTPAASGDSLWAQPNTALNIASVALRSPSAMASDLGFVLLLDRDDVTQREHQSSVGPPEPRDVLWARRSKAAQGTALTADVYVAAEGTRPGFRIPVNVAAKGASGEASCDLAELWMRALRRHLRQAATEPFARFAAERLGENFKRPGALDWNAMSSNADFALGDLMDVTTGRASIEAALQQDVHLRSDVNSKSWKVPLATLSPPRLEPHPWPSMLAALKRAPGEPLAALTPAAFYFVRSRNIEALFQMLDEVENWGTPLLHLYAGRGQRYEVLQRYETELALRRTEVSRVLGPSLIEEMALLGSDPFIALGSDVTLVFRVKNEVLFRANLAENLAFYEKAHGPTSKSQFNHQGVEVELRQSVDREIRRYTAQVAGVNLVSNSRAAIVKVIDTALGKAAALSAELDFQYMLARDAQLKDDVLAYLGDKFIEHCVSPSARVLDARRLLALGELRQPAYATLLHGWAYGEAPSSTAALLKTKLLQAEDLRHFDGTAIDFEIGAAPRSQWGTPRALAPLIDLPLPLKVSQAEAKAYAAFAQQYENQWADAVDPIAVRARIETGGAETRLALRLRILPVVRQSEYREVQELVGQGRLAPGKLAPGLRAVFAIAEDSHLRRELAGASRSFLDQRLGLDWLGRWAMLGLADHASLTHALANTQLVPNMPSAQPETPESLDTFARLPLYLAFEVGNAPAAAVMLAVLRERLNDSSVHWQTPHKYKDYTVNEVRLDDAEGAQLYYALADRVLYVSLNQEVMHQLLDQRALGSGPKSAQPGSKEAEGQFVLDIAGERRGPLLTALGWLFEDFLRATSRPSADAARALFVGAPVTRASGEDFRRLALAYTGSIPVTPDGGLFDFHASGVKDPTRGNDYAPIWPTLPSANSDAARVLTWLTSLRTQLSFDREPGAAPATPQTSLAVEIEIARRRAE